MLNLGIEGILLLGALTAAAYDVQITGSVVVGIACAIAAASSLLGLLFAF